MPALRSPIWSFVVFLLSFTGLMLLWSSQPLSGAMPTIREHGLATLLSGLIACLPAGGVFHYLVNRRLQHLQDAIGDFTAGETGVRLGWRGADPVTRLAMQFDHLVARMGAERSALSMGEKRLDFALHGSNAGIWDWDLVHNETWYAPRWYALLGFNEYELSPHPEEWLKRVHGADLPAVMQRINQHLAGDTEFFESEHRLRHKDGSYLWVLERARAIRDVHGQAYRLVGALTDITGRKQAEFALLQSEKKFRTILNLSPDGFIFVDHEARISYINPAFAQMTALAPDELLNQPLPVLDEYLSQRCDTGQDIPPATHQASLAADYFFLIRPRHIILERLVRSLDPDRHDTPGRVLYFRDITYEKEVERMKNEFLSTAAHELRTPMASIFGFTELLLKREFDKATRHDLYETIHRQTKNLIELINELLDLSRIEAGGEKSFNYNRYDLNDLLREALDAFYLPDSHQLEKQIPEELPPVLADPVKLKQAFTNLLSNAIKYSPAGGTVVLTVEQVEHQGQVQIGIHLRDPGIGMNSEQLAQIFKRFYRADNTGSIPGSGLGLCLVKEIIEHHGGHIALDSTPDAGTTVSIWLPQHPDPAPQLVQP